LSAAVKGCPVFRILPNYFVLSLLFDATMKDKTRLVAGFVFANARGSEQKASFYEANRLYN